ncbi:MAG: hypothetical protein J3K34DRAFT_428378 [Monoraphidium minutum]|nr:MAG: hypothetical protein J3K34DRAFT_428378 [Monoraphidium minutum]
MTATAAAGVRAHARPLWPCTRGLACVCFIAARGPRLQLGHRAGPARQSCCRFDPRRTRKTATKVVRPYTARHAHPSSVYAPSCGWPLIDPLAARPARRGAPPCAPFVCARALSASGVSVPCACVLCPAGAASSQYPYTPAPVAHCSLFVKGPRALQTRSHRAPRRRM